MPRVAGARPLHKSAGAHKNPLRVAGERGREPPTENRLLRAYAGVRLFFARRRRPMFPTPQEMIVSQHNNFTLVVIQMEEVAIPVAAAGEKKEGEGEEKKPE